MILDKPVIHKYAIRGDRINKLLDTSGSVFASHRWLKESLPKRAVYDSLYGDLLFSKKGLKILDIGGGYSSLSKILLENHNYTLLDIMVHDDHDLLREEERQFGKFWINEDWYSCSPEKYDIVIANDIFPNADQRLELFLKRYLPVSMELRMSVTYHNTPKFYTTKRIDAEEIFCQLSYSGEQCQHILNKFFNKDFTSLLKEQESLYNNGRQIYILKERWDGKYNNYNME